MLDLTKRSLLKGIFISTIVPVGMSNLINPIKTEELDIVNVTFDVFKPYQYGGPIVVAFKDIDADIEFKNVLKELVDFGINTLISFKSEPNDSYTRYSVCKDIAAKAESFVESRKLYEQKVICDETNNIGNVLRADLYVQNPKDINFYGIRFTYDPNVT